MNDEEEAAEINDGEADLMRKIAEARAHPDIVVPPDVEPLSPAQAATLAELHREYPWTQYVDQGSLFVAAKLADAAVSDGINVSLSQEQIAQLSAGELVIVAIEKTYGPDGEQLKDRPTVVFLRPVGVESPTRDEGVGSSAVINALRDDNDDEDFV